MTEEHIPDTSGRVTQGDQVVEQQVEPQVNQEAGERPSWLPEKFKSPEDMAKSYAELESRLGKPQESQEQSRVGLETIGGSKEKEPDKGKVTFDGVIDALVTGKEVSEADYKALEKQGIPKETIDRVAKAERAEFESQLNNIYELAGGQDQYRNALQWAAQNYSKEEQEWYDAALDHDMRTASLAVKDLMARFGQVDPSEQSDDSATEVEVRSKPNSGRVTGAAQLNVNTVEKYESVQDYHKDINSQKYKKSQDYRDLVDLKAKRSGFLK